jgi:hypothetical protein
MSDRISGLSLAPIYRTYLFHKQGCCNSGRQSNQRSRHTGERIWVVVEELYPPKSAGVLRSWSLQDTTYI